MTDMVKIEDELYEDFDKKAEEIAEERNCTVFYPEANQLTIDIDDEDQYQNFLKRYSEFVAFTESTYEMKELPSKSGLPHRHIVINSSREYSEIEKVAIQFALASDPVRETLNLWRFFRGVEKPSRFFQPKEEK